MFCLMHNMPNMGPSLLRRRDAYLCVAEFNTRKVLSSQNLLGSCLCLILYMIQK